MTDNPTDDLAAVGDAFFRLQHTIDPFNATQLGVAGFDHLVPDPSRRGSATAADAVAGIEDRLAAIDTVRLQPSAQVDHAVLVELASGLRSDLEYSLWETNASAAGYVSPQAWVFQAVPTALIVDEEGAEGYLHRLRALPGYFDAVAERYRQATAEGRTSTHVGVRQALDQLEGHLALDGESETLANVGTGPEVDGGRLRREAAAVVEAEVRPAMRRLHAVLGTDILPAARPDAMVGIGHVPGGAEGYRAAVRRHTTTDLKPDEIHEIGRAELASLELEWAEIGGRTLGTSDVATIFRRLREDPSLRFQQASEIVAVVTGALERAEAARDAWFPAYRIPDCVIEEINPVEEANAALAYYRPPAGGGARPGAHCVLTANPAARFRYEYEALAFHESTPGHHLQIASAQTLTEVPPYRRQLDAEVSAYVEGWGLYCERLADEMGLYSDDLQRLGMLSFDALRACRLVVDTGMHHFGWSRQQAVDFMWEHTATTAANVGNEIDRYIAWPGQALAYMVGRREIRRLRTLSEDRLGDAFDIRQFHGTVLGSGALPLQVLESVVLRWLASSAGPPGAG